MQDLSKMSTEELLALRQQQQGTFVPSPTAPYEAPQAAAQAQQAQAQANVTQATAPAEIATAALPPGFKWVDPSRPEMGVEKIPGYVEKTSDGQLARDEKTEGKRQKAGIIRGIMGEVIDLYKKDIKGSPPSRLFGLTERFDGGPEGTDMVRSPTAERFTTTARGMLSLIRPMVAMGAKDGDSDKEMLVFEAYIPKAGDSDITIESKLRNLERLLAGINPDQTPTEVAQSLSLESSTPLVDGALGFNRNGDPVSEEEAAKQIQKVYGAPKAAGVGATQARGELPEGFQNTIDNLERGLYQGTLTPEQYAAGRMELDRKEFGAEAADQTGVYMEEAYQRQQLFNQGVTPEQLPPVAPPNRQLSGVDQFRNDLAVSPFGTAVASYADAGSAGLVSMLSPEQMRMAADVSPNAALLGQIGGGVTGAGLVGKLGRETVKRGGGLASKLLGGGGKSQFARNVGTDIAYGTAYGANTGMDVSDAALASTVGSVGGNLAGKLIGKTVAGVNVDPAVQYLKNRNIPLTTGQTLGGMARGIEDKATSIPIVGDIINNRRLEGLQAFNREALDEAGRPIGFNSQRIGREGVSDLTNATGNAYDSALSGVDVPLDAQFLQDTGAAVRPLQNLPADIRRPMGQVMDARIQPIADADRLTGPAYQAARRTLKQTRNSPPQRFQGFEPEYQQAATDLIGALDDQIRRGAGDVTVEALEAANQSNRLGRIVQDATDRAKGGSASGEVDTFTPSQLQMASQTSQRKFPGVNPLRELADQGQRVLPSRIPDSGTAGRGLQVGLGVAGLGALGGGETYATGDASNTALGAGALATLMLGGSRGGQRALNALLTERPDLIRQAAEELARNRLYRAGGGIGGIFGSAAVPVAVNSER